MPSQEVYSELMRQITSLLLFLAGLLLLAAPAAAIAPPRVIAERNLEANIILVGEVLEVIQSSPAHFELKVIHVIKGFERIKEGDQIKVSFKQPMPADISGMRRHQMGTLPVKVEVGQLVVGYINPSKTDAGFFEPLLQGLSIIAVKPATP